MLTPTGKAILGAVPALWILAYATGWHELAVFAGAAFVAVLLAAVWVGRTPSADVVRDVQPSRVRAGKAAYGVVKITPTSRWSFPGAVGLEHVGRGDLRLNIPRISAGSSWQNTYRLPTERRGVISVGPLDLVRSDPLGLTERGAPRGDKKTLWVHPVTYAVPPLPSGTLRDVEGPTSDSSPRGTLAFHTLREYVPGDDPRLIHWRSTARAGKVIVREQVDVSQPDTTIALDLRPASYADDDAFESAVEVAASLAVSSIVNLFPTRVVTTAADDIRTPARSDGAQQLLDQFAALEASEAGDLGHVIGRLRSGRGGAALVVVTGVAADAEIEALAVMRRRYANVVVVSVRPDGGPQMAAAPGVRTIAVPDGPAFARSWMGIT